jgi:MIP family channel proteins
VVNRDWAKLLVVEFLGPFALVFAGVGAILATQGQDIVAIALAHGLAIGLFVAAAGHISGGVYNPALSVGLWATGKLDSTRAVAYIVAQLAGGLAGAAVVSLCFPDAIRDQFNLGTPRVGASFSTTNALIMEIVLTFFLMFVVFGVAIDGRTGGRAVAGLAIGLTITMDIFPGGAVSGAAMNPARWFGPAVIENEYTDGWIWIVGPILGAVIAALLYNFLLLEEAPAAGTQDIDPESPRAAPSEPERG